MPFTFLSHQAVVLPAKQARPRRFDGTALVIGSMAPDFGYVFLGTPLSFASHAPLAQLWFCLPVTLLLVRVIRRFVARPLAAHLPRGAPFHLEDYALTAATSPGLTVTILSALLGSLSHIALDAFTHDDGWAVLHLRALWAPVFSIGGHVTVLWEVLQYAGSVLGAAVTVWLLLRIGRDRRLRTWAGTAAARVDESPPSARSRRLLWGSTALGAVAGLVIALLTPGIGGFSAALIRAAGLTFLGLLVGCILAARHLERRASPWPLERVERAPCGALQSEFD